MENRVITVNRKELGVGGVYRELWRGVRVGLPGQAACAQHFGGRRRSHGEATAQQAATCRPGHAGSRAQQ